MFANHKKSVSFDHMNYNQSKFICISNLDDADVAFYQPILGCNDAISLDYQLSVFDNVIGNKVYDPSVIFNLGFLSTKYNIEHLLRSDTKSLSAFEQMRLKIVKALINREPVIVFTNPTKGLNKVSSRIICKYLKDLTLESITVIVFSTHDYIKKYSDINYQLIDYALVNDN